MAENIKYLGQKTKGRNPLIVGIRPIAFLYTGQVQNTKTLFL